jgi:hypothetical protein
LYGEKKLSLLAGKTKHKDRRDGVPRPSLYDFHVKPEDCNKDKDDI